MCRVGIFFFFFFEFENVMKSATEKKILQYEILEELVTSILKAIILCRKFKPFLVSQNLCPLTMFHSLSTFYN